MARVKPQIPIIPVSTVDEANDALAEIAEIDRAIEAITAQLNQDIDALKAAATEDIAPLAERKKALGGGLANFAQINRAELFKGRKSKEFGFGVIGYRKSTSLGLIKSVATTWREVLGLLKQYQFKDAIRTKEEPDKEVMSEWPSERLGLVGVKRVEQDDFFYEVKREAVE